MVLKTMVMMAGLNQPHTNHDTTSLELSRFGEPLDRSIFEGANQCDHRILMLRKQCGYNKGFVVNPTG